MFESREDQYLVLLLLESLEGIYFFWQRELFSLKTQKLVLLSLCVRRVVVVSGPRSGRLWGCDLEKQ